MKVSASTSSLKNIKPILVFCYICGRQYGSRSFSIHIKTCQQKFHNEQDQKKDQKDRISLPDSPQLLVTILSGVYDSNTLRTFNQEAYQIYKYKVLPKCKFCQRTFNYQSLKVHQKGCDKKPKGPVTYEQLAEDKEISRPKTLSCCVCGRQFGTKSLKIHYPQCLQKFKNDEFMRCTNPKDRRKPPEFTPEQIQLLNNKETWTNDEIEEFYKMAISRFRNQSMMECYNCKRRFVPQSIDKHQKNCILINGNRDPEAHLRKVQSEKVVHFYQKNIKKPKTLTCYICGRQFGLTSLTIHQKTCYQKFKLEQKNKPKNQRKNLPQLPQQILQGGFDISIAESWQAQKIETYNKLISDLYNKKTLTQCYICERTFFEQSLQKHIVHCQNNLQKLKLKRNKSCDENEILKRCESVQKIKRMQKSIQKETIKPRFLMCHVCGRQFGTMSLQIHLKVCAQKFINQQALKQKQKRKELPQLPYQLSNDQYNIKSASQWSSQKIQFYNEIVFDIYNKKALQTCYFCERTFFEESLQKHIKHCQSYTLDKLKRSPSLNQKEIRVLAKHNEIKRQKEMKQSEYSAKVDKSAPKTLVCHICGRLYGLNSLHIHIPNCVKKFIDIENKKPINQRKKIPSIQQELSSHDYDISIAETWSREKIQTYNQVCNRVYNYKSLTKCQYCERTFFDEQLKKHLVFCEKEALRNMDKTSELSSSRKKPLLKKSQSLICVLSHHSDKKIEEPPQPKFLFCHICGREFGLFSLKIHLPQCKGKFIKQQQLKPQEKRKKLPELSFNSNEEKQHGLNFNIDEADTWDMEKIKRYNEICKQVYTKQSLYLCVYCNRSFKEQQLPKHVKFCEKDPFKKVKRSPEEKSQNEDIPINFSQVDSKYQTIYSPNKKAKIENQSLQFSLSFVMAIIEEQQLENSSFSPSPYSKNISQGNSKTNSQVKPFSLAPLEVSRISQEQKNSSIEMKTYYSEMKEIIPNETQMNKSINNSSLKKHSSLIRGIKRSLTFGGEITSWLGSSHKQIEKEQKQCQHCKKKVKSDLYQRHIHMCKSNASMTGYIRKDTPKLKF